MNTVGNAFCGSARLDAACDLVLTNNKAQFSLSEFLFALIPACMLPFLIRRVGFLKAHNDPDDQTGGSKKATEARWMPSRRLAPTRIHRKRSGYARENLLPPRGQGTDQGVVLSRSGSRMHTNITNRFTSK